jgi:hypothetical protein
MFWGFEMSIKTTVALRDKDLFQYFKIEPPWHMPASEIRPMLSSKWGENRHDTELLRVIKALGRKRPQSFA